ncbi:hypothetical protein IGI04_010299 [Brassica rapa subsp. trilocularis]|uniref:Reverse transcriptase zinc-binding domain-containing protein n=1 Tax=Brassica rapa subsp. trilocularis TaxID=1813537 RepID=A0ABQ7MZV3_BRACM|nr:hypothetical protein IGI04_010299 [Brassica rapa subsp. trilocularis]
MFQFRDVLTQLGVFDLRYYGPVHTWTNKRDLTPVVKKLDRCLINSEFLTSFPGATATFLPPAPSDHTPCLTDLVFSLSRVGTQPFRFQNYLTKHPSFLEVVTDAWLLAGNVSTDLASLCWKLKNIKRSLKNLNKEKFSNIQQRVIDAYRHHTTRVSWETVTLAKDHGGLGIKDLHKWNLACILKLVWMIFFRPNSVWVCWFKEVILKGDVANYWTISTSSRRSWLVNKMIKARDLLYPLVKRRIGNGRSTRFWFDNWTPLGKLYTTLNGGSSLLGIPKMATVASLFTAGSWNLPFARTDAQLALQIHLTTVTLSDQEDHYDWMIEGKTRRRYKTGEMYDYLKGAQQMVPWAKVIWISYGIPRHSFLSWLVMLDRCPTRDRLNRWGLNVDPLCLLCNTQPESRNHLFFECGFSADVWRRIAHRCQLQPRIVWEDIILQLQRLSTDRDSRRLTLLAFQATVYWIWTERNTRLHQQLFKTPLTVFSTIDKQIRNRLQSFRHANPRASSAMTQLWFLNS